MKYYADFQSLCALNTYSYCYLHVIFLWRDLFYINIPSYEVNINKEEN